MVQIRVLLFCLVLMMASCTRPSADRSKVFIQTPVLKKMDSSQLATPLPLGKKACYWVDVQGPGIDPRPATTCAPALGIWRGAVAEGDPIVLDVPRGTGRQFRLGVIVIDETLACPGMGDQFLNFGEPFASSYPAGETLNVSLEEPEATITINFTLNLTQSHHQLARLSACLPTATLKGVLLSDGTVQVPATNSTAAKNPVFSSLLFDPGSSQPWGGVSSCGVMNFASTSLQLPSQISSWTLKPDTKKLYGILSDGRVVMADSNSIKGYTIPLTCPFQSCQVPVWIQSISAGLGNQLFALDHAGQIYSVGISGLSFTGRTVPAPVTQISFY